MAAPPGHVHVTEREGAHRWPDGRYDDAAWEDCTFMSGLELARVCHDTGIPATHAEGEALRADSGKPPGGGTNSSDLARALSKRYRFTSHVRLAGFAALWAELTPGAAAESQGSMGAFPGGHHLRRWDPGFAGAHAVFIARMDASDRVWWCDPLAPLALGPKVRYTGEWVSRADLKAFVDHLGGTHVVARFVIPPPDTATEALMGLFTTPRSEPQQRGTIKPGGHTIFRVADGGPMPVPDGFDMGTVTHMDLLGKLPDWAHGDPHVVFFKFGKYGTYAAVIRDVAVADFPKPPAPVTDTKPAVNAVLDQIDAAVKKARPA